MIDCDNRNIQIVHEFCTYHIDHIANSLMHQFYANEYEKLFILGKMQAYQDVVQIIKEFEQD